MNTTVKTPSKDILARAMAMEDIIVEHDAQAATAYFDTKSRRLVLPIWKDMDASLYDMLIGHEVSHALNTPADGWRDWVGEGPEAQIRHQFLNIVEDARIERMIKNKFPGLRRDFAAGYRSLHSRDMFELDGKDMKQATLIDRLNLYFKLGLFGVIDIPFSTDEKQYVDRMASTDTFEEVMDLASDLYNLWKQEEEEKQQEQQEQQGQQEGSEDGEGIPQPASGQEESKGEDGSGGMMGSASDDDANTSNGSGDSDEDCGQSMEDDTDDGKSADSTKGENSSQDGSDQTDLSYDAYSNCPPSQPGSTQRSFERAISDLRDEDSGGYMYRELPRSAHLDSIIVDYKKIEEEWDKLKGQKRNGDEYSITNRQKSDNLLVEFNNKSKAVVQHMVQQFMMKQSADADKKTSIAKTGILDTVNVINYRWSEDIFLKNEIHADGKNHGIVMFVDWSSSMRDILNDTVEQLLVLVEFCRKANIPYEVYTFSSRMFDGSDEFRKNTGQFDVEKSDIQPHGFQLYNVLSSRMNSRSHKTAVGNLWFVAYSSQYGRYGSAIPPCMSMGCTPLNETILAAMDIIPEFQKKNNVQIVNTVVLSDGYGHSMVGYHYGNEKTFIRDKHTHKNYEIKPGCVGETYALVRALKDRTGCNAIGIHLHGGKNIRGLRWEFFGDLPVNVYENACKSFKKNKFLSLDRTGYDEYFVIQGNIKIEFDAFNNLDEEASMAKIRNAFCKGAEGKKKSRTIASRIVEIIS